MNKMKDSSFKVDKKRFNKFYIVVNDKCRFDFNSLKFTWKDVRDKIVLYNKKDGYGTRLELTKDGRLKLYINDHLVKLCSKSIKEIIGIRPGLFSQGEISFMDQNYLIMETNVNDEKELLQFKISKEFKNDYDIVAGLLNEALENSKLEINL